VWTLPGGVPPVLEPDCDEPVCIDLDATLMTAHSDKDGASGTYKGTFGSAPNMGFLDRGDGTGEALAAILCSGNATDNNAADNIDLLEAARQALPSLRRGPLPDVAGHVEQTVEGRAIRERTDRQQPASRSCSTKPTPNSLAFQPNRTVRRPPLGRLFDGTTGIDTATGRSLVARTLTVVQGRPKLIELPTA
jgi:hypothetical protein